MERSGDIFPRFHQIFLRQKNLGGVIGPRILLNLRFLRVWGAYKPPLNEFIFKKISLNLENISPKLSMGVYIFLLRPFWWFYDHFMFWGNFLWKNRPFYYLKIRYLGQNFKWKFEQLDFTQYRHIGYFWNPHDKTHHNIGPQF